MTPQFPRVKILVNFYLFYYYFYYFFYWIVQSSACAFDRTPRPPSRARSIVRPGRLACRERNLLQQRIFYRGRTLLSHVRLGRVRAQGMSLRSSTHPDLYYGSLCHDNEFLYHDRTRSSAHLGLSVTVHVGTAVRVTLSRRAMPGHDRNFLP